MWGDFIEGAGFKLSRLYTPQRIHHDSTLCDASCLFVSSSGVDSEENCKELSGKLERGTRFVPRLQMQERSPQMAGPCFSGLPVSCAVLQRLHFTTHTEEPCLDFTRTSQEQDAALTMEKSVRITLQIT